MFQINNHQHGQTIPEERIRAVDVLRGLALFGILAMNLGSFLGSDWYSFRMQYVSAVWDRAALAAIVIVGWGKFLALFSFLFGLGFAFQDSRIRARGGRPLFIHLRRMAILLVFGCLHLAFGWIGDILHSYALLGILLIFLVMAPSKVLLAIGLAALLWMPVRTAVLQNTLTSQERTQLAKKRVLVYKRYVELTNLSRASYVKGVQNRIEATRIRYTDPVIALSSFTLPLPGMLLGIWVGRRKWLSQTTNQAHSWKKAFAISAILGCALTLAFFFLQQKIWMPITTKTWGMLYTPLREFGIQAMMLSYIAAVVLLIRIPAWRQRLAWLVPVGRAPLTNYLMQTIICVILFQGPDFSGKWGPAAAFIFSVPIFATQCLLSAWWFRRFEQGPMESLWRYFTYPSAPKKEAEQAQWTTILNLSYNARTEIQDPQSKA